MLLVVMMMMVVVVVMMVMSMRENKKFRAGFLDAFRHRTAGTQTDEEPGLRVAVAHVIGRWRSEAERPPAFLAGQEPFPEVFPEGLQWLLRRGTFVEWRSWRSYRLSTVPRHELVVERWEVSLTVDGFRWQLSQQEHSLLRVVDSPLCRAHSAKILFRFSGPKQFEHPTVTSRCQLP